MLVSRNHYAHSWGLSTFRRLKNVICVLDWVPGEIDPNAVGEDLTPQQSNELEKMFSLMDGSARGAS